MQMPPCHARGLRIAAEFDMCNTSNIRGTSGGADAGCDAYVEKGSGWTRLLTVLKDVLRDNNQ